MSLLAHIHHLSVVIGPRGSTTESEAKAHDYVQQTLAALGVSAVRQPFLSATSAYAPFILGAGAALLGVFLFWQLQPVGAAAALIVTVVAFASLILELNLCDNPLRWIVPTAASQNVVATIPATTADRPPILITAHVDTHRTPLLFSSPGWRRIFRALMPVGLVSIAILIVLFAAGVLSQAVLLRQLALIPGAAVAILVALMIQATTSTFSPGANDNASGVAVALELVRRLAQQPLARRDVIVAFTGCEEVGAYGVEALVKARLADLRGAIHLVIDHVGGLKGHDLGPSIIQSEKFLRRYACDRALVATAEFVAREHPTLGVCSRDFDLAYSELTVGARYGLRTIGLMGLMPDGDLPRWHVKDDVIAHVDEATLERSAEFAWHLLRAFDAED